MTDEQVDRIVEALQGGDPWWVPLLLTLIGAIVGFVASHIQERISRARKKTDDDDLARRTAAQGAMTHTVLIYGLTPGGISSRLDQLIEQRPPIATAIFDISVDVATWWMSQINMLLERDGAGRNWSESKDDERKKIAASTLDRMNKWGRGEISSESFSKTGNEEWAKARES